ncbi:MAG: VanZ family protein [Lachnospiraceae bacterium]|nr:VanZ family protein [Lachnospiraceae bacterium]
MSITDILIRSIAGYVFVVPGVLLYFGYLMKTKKQTLIHFVASIVFCYYLVGIFTMVGIHAFKTFSPRIVLVPFVDMISGPVDTVLNVILFIPLGFFLPLLYKKYDRVNRVALTGFLFSISIEIVQMFGMGATDINDLITNTVGTCLGYYIYKVLFKLVRKELFVKFRAKKVNDYIEVLFFALYSLAVMVTIQPFIIHKLFRLG